ncbi:MULTISPECIES: DUF389 domain-containing protein [Cyanophyceae]|uniref:DUF389 domain-containing protein n=1 Tax=Leptolyngbya subtilissima DQ-A4 TaxID=2933933 RepID=A0ABV0KBW8_9CYAN|nr:DUF389 domain-containing protein [Nodosilinea sp. FACHB-141]MBD2115044.1 DUF389 domain-containing protein [Nodosilinea sp. FACHB-141]
MRQLLIQVPWGVGKTVLQKARACQGTNLAQWQTGGDTPRDMVLVHVSNQRVEPLIEALQDLPELEITLVPTGVMALHPPADQAAEQVTQVEERSPIEIFLAGLQSVGSWKGFLGYAAIAGVIVWIGLFTNTNYLLVAAMLIAPFAGPAMNTAIASARGDRHLMGRSVLRYFTALLVTIGVAALLSLVFRQQIATPSMIDNSQVSAVAVLLPLAAGAAGAVNLVQSERSSLVSGTATGMLVAASLAPPAGIVGMSTAIGRWDLVVNGVFLLLLQLSGINLSAAILFRTFGLSTKGARYQRGQRGVFPVALGVSAIAIAVLLTWQLSNSPSLERSSRAQRANAAVQQVVQQSDSAQLVESNVRFTRANIQGQNTLLCVVYVQRQPEAARSIEQIRTDLTQAIQAHLLAQDFNAMPLVNVIVLETPPEL